MHLHLQQQQLRAWSSAHLTWQLLGGRTGSVLSTQLTTCSPCESLFPPSPGEPKAPGPACRPPGRPHPVGPIVLGHSHGDARLVVRAGQHLRLSRRGGHSGRCSGAGGAAVRARALGSGPAVSAGSGAGPGRRAGLLPAHSPAALMGAPGFRLALCADASGAGEVLKVCPRHPSPSSRRVCIGKDAAAHLRWPPDPVAARAPNTCSAEMQGFSGRRAQTSRWRPPS